MHASAAGEYSTNIMAIKVIRASFPYKMHPVSIIKTVIKKYRP